MKPKKLVLKGIRGIRDGMGLDAYELDLEGLGEARLIAIAGLNGKGKSTVLDNLHPYPILPSRATSYSIAAFSMYDHIVPPEAMKSLVWEHQGRTYKSELLWRVSGKRKSTLAYLFEHQEGMEWVPVCASDGTKSDGKLETYCQTLNAILGTPEMFFSSVFAAQGRRKLFEYKEGELKQLLAELLDLGSITQLGTAAAQVLRGLGSAADAMRVAASPPHGAPDAEALGANLAAAEASVSALTAGKATEEVALRAAQGIAAKAKAEVERDTSKEVRERLTREAATLKANEEREKAQRASQEKQLRAETAGIDAAATRARADLASQRKSRTEAITYRQGLLAQREASLAASGIATKLEAEISNLETAMTAAKLRLEAQTKAKGELVRVDGELAGKRKDYTQAKQGLAQIEVRAQFAREVPCHDSDLQPKCKLLKEAMEAIAKIPEAQKVLEALAADGVHLAKKRGEVEVRTKEGGDPAKEISEAEAAQTGLRKAKEEAEKLAALAPNIERAQAEVEQLQQELTNLDAEHAKLSEEREARKAAIVSQLATIAEEAQATADFFTAEQAKIAGELAKVAAPDATALTAATAALEAQASKLRQVDRELSQAITMVSGLKAQLAAAREGARQRAGLEERHQRLRAEMAYWQLLAKALGKDGIVAMLIDEAGPVLASIANDILLACYGRRFTVSIVTQRPQANGEMAETFDIVVHDAESDEAKSLSVMSGGQKVWINEALTRAIALYRQGSQKYATLFGDESDGPLDPEKKRMFVAMQRKVLELGGYERAYFITQTPELLGLADRVVNLG